MLLFIIVLRVRTHAPRLDQDIPPKCLNMSRLLDRAGVYDAVG